MYTYTFTIYSHVEPQEPYITIILEAKDRVSPYESILIQKYNEKREDWSTSVRDSCKKDVPWDGELFFGWLSRQSLFDYGDGRILLSCFSPYALYAVLDKSDKYIFSFDSNDPEDIEDPGTYFSDKYKDLPITGVVF